MSRFMEIGRRSIEIIHKNKLRIALGASLLGNAGLVFDAAFNQANVIQGAKNIIMREL